MQKVQKIQERIVNTKRHTVGYMINGKRVTRGAAVRLAQRNHIQGVKVCYGPYGMFLMSRPPHRNLYNLPVVVEG